MKHPTFSSSGRRIFSARRAFPYVKIIGGLWFHHAGLGGRKPPQFPRRRGKDAMGTILWIIFIGFVAGIVARLLSPGPNNPGGFLLTTVLGVAGAFLATWLGQLVGWYRPDQGARFIGAIVGSLIILFIWNRLVAHRIVHDPGDQRRLP